MFLRLRDNVREIEFSKEFSELELLVYEIIVRSSNEEGFSFILFRDIRQYLDIENEDGKLLFQTVEAICSKTYEGKPIMGKTVKPVLPNGQTHSGTMYSIYENPLLERVEEEGSFIVEPNIPKTKPKKPSSVKKTVQASAGYNAKDLMELFKRQYERKFGERYEVENYPKEMSQLKRAFIESGMSEQEAFKVMRTLFKHWNEWTDLPLTVATLTSQPILFSNANRVIDGEHVEKDTLFVELGLLFEDMLEDVLDELGLKFTTQGCHIEYLFPDFVLEGGTRWVDAKLSEDTVFSSKTIERYTPHCDELTIVFLHGDKDRFERIDEKVRIVSVFRLIKDIEDEHVREKLQTRFEKLFDVVSSAKQRSFH